MPSTNFKDRLTALGLPAVDRSSTACSCALAILKLLPQADLDDQTKDAIDAQAAHEASLKADLEKDPTAFVVSAHLAYCTLCEKDVPMEAHYSKTDWERHLSTCHPAAKEEDGASDALSGASREGPTCEPTRKRLQRESRDAQVQITTMVEEGPPPEYKSSDASLDSVRKTPRTPRRPPRENSFTSHAHSPATKGRVGVASGQRAGKAPLGPSRSLVNIAGFPTTSILTTGNAKLGRYDAEPGSSPTA
ncbi:uncharacterized protein SCHCODRAFT_02530680 [Schizophyllum commune H4-8]|uniref:Uncharacterized protein n=1 Tax=Schizophyllum commune (strain H4-8 / FGSC 9210) TaxID=578458 RepID=D8PN78_SCHCM|nr:uncharacterized protein SCHCODRAFT_02530680 [Schizophyllum commune H4-8]KAI5898631.1 hypothetical protein SCHCODRAFT_02530680 [Schizophyllum commune H4-8]